MEPRLELHKEQKDMSKKLAGKVAVVTGASKGIGASIAQALADEERDDSVAASFEKPPRPPCQSRSLSREQAVRS